MSGRREHPGDRIQDLLDGRLDASERTTVERHLETCPTCRRERDELARVKDAVSSLAPEAAPDDLAPNVTALLDREDRSRKETDARSAGRRVWKRAAVLAAAAALAIIAVLSVRSGNVVSAADDDYSAYREGKLPLELVSGDPRALERFFAERGIGDARVFDLSMMRYRLAGGRIHAVRGRQSAFWVYEGEGNKILVCQMYPGTASELPPGAERREHGGIPFFVYGKDTRTLVFWQEGNVICALVSEAGREEVVQLAFAKAVKV